MPLNCTHGTFKTNQTLNVFKVVILTTRTRKGALISLRQQEGAAHLKSTLQKTYLHLFKEES